MLKEVSKEIKLIGVGCSPGICTGKAYIVEKQGADIVEKYYLEKGSIKSEKNRFKIAVKRAKDELKKIIVDLPANIRQHANILETQILLLKDKMLYGKTIEIIENEHINAEWALKKVALDARSIFQKMSDSYFRDRADDIIHVSERIMRNLVGAEDVNLKNIDKRVILVARDLSPGETSQIQLEKIKGIITDRGAITSHTSIIARSLEIPAVFGLGNSTSIIKEEDLLIVDGTSGVVVVNPLEQTLHEYSMLKNRLEEYKAMLNLNSNLKAKTIDNVLIHVMGNIELPEEVVSVINYGGDGIGLYRTEFQYLSNNGFPDEDELFDKYKNVVEVMAPKFVTIRTLDINGDKTVAYASNSNEANPALGLRAIRYCLKKPEIFLKQLRAILRAAVYGNVRVLFPMISDYTEIIEAKRLLDNAAISLLKEGTPYKRDIEIGIMIEVPSAVIMADVLADYVDFFSIGTNDLIQYCLAIDRDNQHVAHLYNPFHPAIIRMIKHVSYIAKEKGIKVFMCGEMAGDPINVPILLGLGIDELSMNPPSIPSVKNMIRSLSVIDTKILIEDILKKTKASEITDLLQSTYGNLISEKFLKN